MSFTGFLSKVFGDKSSRDRKQLQPIVDKINALGPEMKGLDNDGLRARIDAVRTDIANAISADEKSIAEIREKVETLPYDQRQPLWDDIDKHEKNIIDTIEEQLEGHLVEVFACLRETAARFAANEEVVVTATQMDRDLAAQGRDFVRIEFIRFLGNCSCHRCKHFLACEVSGLPLSRLVNVSDLFSREKTPNERIERGNLCALFTPRADFVAYF